MASLADLKSLKPFIKELFDVYAVPVIKAQEDKIGSDVLKVVVEEATAALEAAIDAALS